MKATIRTPTVIALLLYGIFTFSADAGGEPGTIVAWGGNPNGETNIPPNLFPVFGIAAGLEHYLALRADGRIVGWGNNSSNAATNYLGLTDVVALSAGRNFSVGLRKNGSVAAWGRNDHQQSNFPQGLSDCIAISSGDFHTLALRANRSVVAWGDNSYSESTVPSWVTNAVAVAAGWEYSLVLKGDGTIVGWGYNQGNVSTPPAGLNNVVAIAAGGFQNLALKADGTVVGWPNNVPAGLSNIVAIAAGFGGCLALKSDGTVTAWGGAATPPVGLSNLVKIAVGGYSCFALIAPGPAITSRPPVAASVADGGIVNLSVSVLSSNTYSSQWFLNEVPLMGETSTNLLVGGFNISKAGTYSIVVSNAYGSDTATSVVRLINSPIVLVDGVDVGGGKVDCVDSASITMTNTSSGAAIYFTLDGSAPDFTDIPYTGPFTLTNSATIRAIAYNVAFTESAEAAHITVQVWPTYPLSATTPGGGSIGLAPAPYSAGNRYVSNTVVTLTATPSNNWSFLGWTGDSSATSNVTSVLMDRARTVTGVFGTALNLFTNGSGQVQLNPPTGPNAFGSTVQFTALPAPGYYFFGWANAASGFGNPLTFPVTNAAGITANFGALAGNQVSLVVLPNGNGTVSVNPAKNVYTNGESVTLTAWPAANQTFTGWSGDGAGNLNPLVLTLTSSKLITANFAPGAPTNPPVITQPPLSRTLGAGASTLLSFALTGDGPFSYQWRLNQSAISGATNPTLNLVDVMPTDAGRYEIVVIGPGGAVTSAPAAVALFGLEFAASGNRLQPLLTLYCAPGTSFHLEHAWNLSATNWSLLAPVTLSGSQFYYVDSPDTNYLRRFYRAVPQ